jgi:hypothetical protein
MFKKWFSVWVHCYKYIALRAFKFSTFPIPIIFTYRHIAYSTLLICTWITISHGETYKTIYSPFTGKLDFVTVVTSGTLPTGSTQYIQNRNTLQTGATAYPAYHYVGSSQTIGAQSTLSIGNVSAASMTYVIAPSSGTFFNGGYCFAFDIYAFKTFEDITVYSATENSISACDPGTSTDNYYWELTWEAVSGASGYLLVIIEDSWNGFAGDAYITTTALDNSYEIDPGRVVATPVFTPSSPTLYFSTVSVIVGNEYVKGDINTEGYVHIRSTGVITTYGGNQIQTPAGFAINSPTVTITGLGPTDENLNFKSTMTNTAMLYTTSGVSSITISNMNLVIDKNTESNSFQMGKSSDSRITFEYVRPPNTNVTATNSGTGGFMGAGTWNYSVSFVMEDGTETEHSTATYATAITTAATSSVSLTNIPTGTARVSGRKIYRSAQSGQATPAAFHTINNNTATVYTDTTPCCGFGASPWRADDGTAASAYGNNTGGHIYNEKGDRVIDIWQEGQIRLTGRWAGIQIPANPSGIGFNQYRFAHFNTTDESLNPEWGGGRWNSNVWEWGTFKRGTASTSRQLKIGSDIGSSTELSISMLRGATAPAGWYEFTEPGTSNGGLNFFRIIHNSWTASSGSNTLFTLSHPSIAMSGTAGYTLFETSFTETSAGSGTKRIYNVTKNKGTVFYLDSNANLVTAGSVSVGTETKKVYLSTSGIDLPNDGVLNTNGARVGLVISTYSPIGAYSFTTATATIAVGTSSSTITLTSSGTYRIDGMIDLRYTGATFAANQFVTLNLYRQNNTPGVITNSQISEETGVVTTITNQFGQFNIPPIYYTTTNTNDVLSIHGSITATPAAGSFQATQSSLVATRLY